MRGAFLICKKEFLELSKDRKTLFFTFVMPLILYPLLFGMIGKMNQADAARREGKASRVYLVDPGQVLEGTLQADPKLIELVEKPAVEVKQAIRDQKLELMVEVEPEAARKLQGHETFGLKATFDPSDQGSRLALTRLKEALKKQDTRWVQERLKGMGANMQLAVPTKLETVEAADMGLAIGKILGSFLPYILMIMMFAGAMQHGIYATAGEKERGTLTTLLATSLPRNQIIWGKLLYIFSIGLISALINLLSMAISMGRLIGSEAASHGAKAAQAAAEAGMAQAPSLGALSALANPTTLVLSFLLMIPLGLFFANFIVLGGIQARNTVEAGTALTPGIFVVVIMGVFSMSPGIEKLAFLPYVPVLNVSLAIRKLFSQQGNMTEYLVALGMTVGLAALMTWISTRFLNRESALFKV